MNRLILPAVLVAATSYRISCENGIDDCRPDGRTVKVKVG